ncbi:MAG: glycosyltransferase family 39 protein [Methanospirillum sp.]|uniref:glycosyltransferase family 39 protein n=1 Tax=Methanospirillum sp. TaxID=45200 RepID=UPI002371F8EF|nr:glycosyltransferase family 39 protein [Methanospirillum sp.]MDD1728688.1 glycosyltransferase family 39 protein [Methanospirillum sp.]
MRFKDCFTRIQNNKSVMRACSIASAHAYIVLFIFTFVIYNLNFRNINSFDTLAATILPFTILDTHVPWLTTSSLLLQPENISSFIAVNNNLYSYYPIVTPILVTPLYVVSYIFMKMMHIPLDMSNSSCFLIVYIMEKIAASFITAAAITVFYAGMKEVIRKNIALITALILAFGTSMWSINSQALWQHGMIALLFSIGFYLIIRNERQTDSRIFILLGICSGLLVFTRPADAFLVLPAFVYAALKRREDFVTYCVSAGIATFPIVIYNESVAGNLFGGYSNLLSEFSFGLPTLVHMAGLLISPNRGLFVFTPIAILALLGIFQIRSTIKNLTLQRVFISCGIAFILEILVYSAFDCWWAGTTYGPRFLAGSLPLIFILVGIFLDSQISTDEKRKDGLSSAKIVWGIVIVLVAWSIFVQVVGAFYYPNGNWNDSPSTFTLVGSNFATADTSRLWSITDNQIFTTFNAGPIIINPINILENLQRKNDIIDPSTDFPIRIGTNFNNGWSKLEYHEGHPFRTIANYSSVSIQYMRYSLVQNNCTLLIVASAVDSPKTLEVTVNGKSAGNLTVPDHYTELSLPVKLKSSLRLGNNLIEFRVPDECNTAKGIRVPEQECLTIQNIKINRQI